jgi:hypothetical protein
MRRDTKALRLFLALLALTLVNAQAGATNNLRMPPLPATDYPLIDAFDYPDSNAVQAAWTAMWGTASAETSAP